MWSFFINETVKSREHRGLPIRWIDRKFPRNLRGYLYRSEDSSENIGFQAVLSRRWAQFGFSIALTQGEGEFVASITVPCFCLYLTWSTMLAYKLAKKLNLGYADREISLKGYWEENGPDFIFRWYIWTDPDEWNNKMPWWEQGSFYVLDRVFGRFDSTREVVHTEDRIVHVPSEEDGTPTPNRAKIKIEKWEGSRERCHFLFARGGFTGSLDVHDEDPGYTHPGKGTAAYNCGPDAIRGVSTPVSGPRAVEDVLSYFIKAGEQNRRRYPL